MEAYYPDPLPLKKIKEEKYKEIIMEINLELGRFDGMLKFNSEKEIVEAFLRAEEVLAAASLEVSELSFDEYWDKLLDRGYEADDLVEIRFMIDEYSKYYQEDFSLDLLNSFQQSLYNNRNRRRLEQSQLHRTRQGWLVQATKRFDIRLYIHPKEDKIRFLFNDLNNFIRKSQLHPLITAAIAYGQLVMIHPWRYANGRVTGSLIPFLFNHLGITRERNFYLSSIFSQEKEHYYQQLVSLFKAKTWDEWIYYFLRKLQEQLIKINEHKTPLIINTYRNCSNELNKLESKLTSKYVDTLFSNPIFSKREIEGKYSFINYGTLSDYTSLLIELGYIIKDNRKRHINYVFAILKEL